MRYVAAFIAAFAIAVVYASALPYWRILGVTPDLVLIFVACWAMLRGQDEAMVVVPLAGFLRDLMTSDPLGTSVLALAPIVLLATLREFKIVETDFVPTVVVVVAGSLAYGVIALAVLAATGQTVPWSDAIIRAVLPAVIVNGLFTPIIYLPLRWFQSARRPQGAGYGLAPPV